MKFQKKDGAQFSIGKISALAYAGMETLPADLSIINVAGRRGSSKSTKSDRYFFIINGNGHFTVGDIKYDVFQEDVIFVIKNTIFNYEGEMQMIEFSTPPYDPAAEIDLE